MLKNIHVGNVRVFKGEDWDFPLSTLTIFCGANSAGKSTILKSLLLLRQSLGFRETRATRQGQLHLTGTQIDMGRFATVISDENNSLPMVLGVSFNDTISSTVLRELLPARTRIPAAARRSSLPYTLKATFRFINNGQAEQAIGAVLDRADFSLSVQEQVYANWSIGRRTEALKETDDFRYQATIPEKAVQSYLKWLKRYTQIASSATEFKIIARLSGLLPDRWQLFFPRGTVRAASPIATVPFPIPAAIQGAQSDLELALSRITYLGPFRAPAKRFYVVTDSAINEADPTGAGLPFTLRERGDTAVDYVRPGDSERSKDTLSKALSWWLFYFRTGERPESEPADEVEIRPLADILVEFRLRSTDADKLHSVADSGFGYSQLLPILVQTLLSRTGSTVIIEQPELHLNPALQVRLASFFISLARSGKQILLETHSEHIVNAIRVASAEDENGWVHKHTKLYFVHGGSHPNVTSLDIQADGTVPDWPIGFFGEALGLSARLLKAQRRFVRQQDAHK